MSFRFRKTRKKTCEGKQSYPKRRKAHKARRVQFRRYGRILYVYRCDKCEQYHLSGEATIEYEREDDDG